MHIPFVIKQRTCHLPKDETRALSANKVCGSVENVRLRVVFSRYCIQIR